MNLVIVESPKKAELISGFLKKHQLNDYKVMASAGHVRDLKQHSFSVNVEDHFRPRVRHHRGQEEPGARTQSRSKESRPRLPRFR